MSSYNGWTNYETWAVKLWMDNDEGLYAMQREWAQDAQNAAAVTVGRGVMARKPEGILADTIKEFVEENAPETTGLYADLLNSAIGNVNWMEIAQNILSDEE